MSQFKEFLSPKMTGSRFGHHSIPLEWLKDLSVLEQFVLELAKYFYLKDNPDRQRIIRGFNQGISLSLTKINEGSAIPVIEISYPEEQHLTLFPNLNFQYFDKAKECIINTIEAAANDDDISQYMPEEFISYFEKLGRSLRDDEAIEFTPENPLNKCRFDKTTRRKIIFASAKQNAITEETEVRGSVVDIYVEKSSFKTKLYNGQTIVIEYNQANKEDVFIAGQQFPKAKLLIKGIGKLSRDNKLLGFSEVESITLLDSLDIFSQLEELATLQPGWLNGKGVALVPENLTWFGDKFENSFSPALILPRLYPTAEGNIQAEWSTDNYEVSLEVDLATKIAEYQSVNVKSEECVDLTLNLLLNDDWERLNQQLTQIFEL